MIYFGDYMQEIIYKKVIIQVNVLNQLINLAINGSIPSEVRDLINSLSNLPAFEEKKESEQPLDSI